MANTFKKIETATLGSGGGTITFSSIPQTYTDLYLVISSRKSTTSTTDLGIRFNSEGTYNNFTSLTGTGSTLANSSFTNMSYNYVENVVPGTNFTSLIFGSTEMYIPNYTNSSTHSTLATGVNENDGTNAYQVISAGINTSVQSAITSISIVSGTGTLVQYTSATLYGIKSS